MHAKGRGGRVKRRRVWRKDRNSVCENMIAYILIFEISPHSFILCRARTFLSNWCVRVRIGREAVLDVC